MGTENLFLMTLSEKVADLETQFGTNAKITRVYSRISELMGERFDIETLDGALYIVEKELAEGKLNFQS